MTKIAVIGAGLIGRAWSIVFARAGFDVALWDPFPQAITAAQDFIAERLPELHEAGLLPDQPAAVRARIRPAASLADAVRGAEHVQENGPERVADKQRIFGELDLLAHADTVLASSTSGIPASAFTEGLTGPLALPGGASGQPAVSHSVWWNYVPSPWTEPGVVARTRELMTRAGQVPATVRHEMEGLRAEPVAGRACLPRRSG